MLELWDNIYWAGVDAWWWITGVGEEVPVRANLVMAGCLMVGVAIYRVTRITWVSLAIITVALLLRSAVEIESTLCDVRTRRGRCWSCGKRSAGRDGGPCPKCRARDATWTERWRRHHGWA